LAEASRERLDLDPKRGKMMYFNHGHCSDTVFPGTFNQWVSCSLECQWSITIVSISTQNGRRQFFHAWDRIAVYLAAFQRCDIARQTKQAVGMTQIPLCCGNGVGNGSGIVVIAAIGCKGIIGQLVYLFQAKVECGHGLFGVYL
jgi:hypothetical protein